MTALGWLIVGLSVWAIVLSLCALLRAGGQARDLPRPRWRPWDWNRDRDNSPLGIDARATDALRRSAERYTRAFHDERGAHLVEAGLMLAFLGLVALWSAPAVAWLARHVLTLFAAAVPR